MSNVITITGQAIAAGSAQTVDLGALLLPPIKSVLVAEQIVNDLELATPAFSGTGLTAAGQDLTTTDVHTMTENECAGMWVVPITGATPPVLILSNTAVTGAAAVLTCQGVPATDAGTYKIVKAVTRSALTVVTATPTVTNTIQRVSDTTLSVWLTIAHTADDILILTVEETGQLVRPT